MHSFSNNSSKSFMTWLLHEDSPGIVHFLRVVNQDKRMLLISTMQSFLHSHHQNLGQQITTQKMVYRRALTFMSFIP